MRKALLLFIGLLVLYAHADDRKVVVGEYWIDSGYDSPSTVSIGSDGLVQFSLNASALNEGLHTLNFRAKDSEGLYSPMQTWLFYRQRLGNENASKTTGFEYWTDDRNDLLKHESVSSGNIRFTLDMSSLKEGLHSLNYRVQDDKGNYSPTQQWMFYRYVNDQADGCTLEYWIDEAEHISQSVSKAEVSFVMDASSVAEGLHTLHYRLNTLSGQTGAESKWLFYRVDPEYKAGNYNIEYWIDEDTHQTCRANENDVFFMVDASTVEEGLHTLHYLLKEDGGHVSPQYQWQFYRTVPKPAGQRISWYRIWWNDHQDKAVDIQVTHGGTELLYEQTLAVPEYARNDGFSRDNTARFHIVFGDDAGEVSPMETAVVGYPDVYPPVTTLKVTKDGDNAKFTWQANEDGVRDYNVYYSENGEPYVLWKPNITLQEATFRGQKGCTYRFLVTARDINGNYEAMDNNNSVKVEF